MKMEQTECFETSAYKIQTPVELPRRKHTTYRTRQKFEMKNIENDAKQTVHRTTQKLVRVWAVSRLCGFYSGICLATEDKARKNLS
jgi:hypothetical protein